MAFGVCAAIAAGIVVTIWLNRQAYKQHHQQKADELARALHPAQPATTPRVIPPTRFAYIHGGGAPAHAEACGVYDYKREGAE